MIFIPCQGGDNCTEGGTHCQGCGRSHEEIAETKKLIDALVQFTQKMDFENVEEFTSFVATRAAGKYRMQQGGGMGLGLNIQPGS